MSSMPNPVLQGWEVRNNLLKGLGEAQIEGSDQGRAGYLTPPAAVLETKMEVEEAEENQPLTPPTNQVWSLTRFSTVFFFHSWLVTLKSKATPERTCPLLWQD